MYGGGSSGVFHCFAPSITLGSPCTNLNVRDSASGHVPRVNLTYKITPDALVYATWSKGFRPGGVNRTAQVGIPPYQADFLTNWEIGWKTQWFGHSLRWNGSVFQEDWKNFQFSFLGQNSVTIIENGGNARIRGISNDIEWQATDALNLSTNFTFVDPRLNSDYCGETDPATGAIISSNPCPGLNGDPAFSPLAPKGTNLPVTPKFKGNVVARYNFPEVMDWKPTVQGGLRLPDADLAAAANRRCERGWHAGGVRHIRSVRRHRAKRHEHSAGGHQRDRPTRAADSFRAMHDLGLHAAVCDSDPAAHHRDQVRAEVLASCTVPAGHLRPAGLRRPG